MHVKEVFTFVNKENVVISQIPRKQIIVGTSWGGFGFFFNGVGDWGLGVDFFPAIAVGNVIFCIVCQ